MRSWRTIRVRPAPSAQRIANSRFRPVARTRSRFATFAQAMSRTRPTATAITSSDDRTSPTIVSRRGFTTNSRFDVGKGITSPCFRGR